MAQDLIPTPRNMPPCGLTALPAINTDAGEQASRRFMEFFTANIRNPNTHQAYGRAVGQTIPFNPAASVRGPKHVVKKGKTPVFSLPRKRACCWTTLWWSLTTRHLHFFEKGLALCGPFQTSANPVLDTSHQLCRNIHDLGDLAQASLLAGCVLTVGISQTNEFL